MYLRSAKKIKSKYLVGYSSVKEKLQFLDYLNCKNSIYLILPIFVFFSSSSIAQELKPWEIFAWCSIPNDAVITINNGLTRKIELPFDRSRCDGINEIEIPKHPDYLMNLTIPEFNNLFEFTVGDKWYESIERYRLYDYVLEKSKCISFDHNRPPRFASGNIYDKSVYSTTPVEPDILGPEFENALTSDLMLVALARPSFWGLLKNDSISVYEKLSKIQRQDFNIDLWGSVSRLLETKNPRRESEEAFYNAFVASIELQIRNALLENREIWLTGNRTRGIVLTCPEEIFSNEYWLRLQGEKRSLDEVIALQVAALFFVENFIGQEASRTAEAISDRNRIEFFCGDPLEVLRGKIRGVPAQSWVKPEIFHYVTNAGAEIDCAAWKEKYFEHAKSYLEEFFEKNSLETFTVNQKEPQNVNRPISPISSYSSPFE